MPSSQYDEGLRIWGFPSQTNRFRILKRWPRWWFRICLFSPLFGEDSHFDYNIFQLSWNHQLVTVFLSKSKKVSTFFPRSNSMVHLVHPDAPTLEGPESLPCPLGSELFEIFLRWAVHGLNAEFEEGLVHWMLRFDVDFFFWCLMKGYPVFFQIRYRWKFTMVIHFW